MLTAGGISCPHIFIAGIEPMAIRFKWLAVILLSLMFTAACGQKGPLFLPGNPSEIQSDVPRQEPAEEDEEDTEEQTADQQQP